VNADGSHITEPQLQGYVAFNSTSAHVILGAHNMLVRYTLSRFALASLAGP
jgi:hypothetical protein